MAVMVTGLTISYVDFIPNKNINMQNTITGTNHNITNPECIIFADNTSLCKSLESITYFPNQITLLDGILDSGDIDSIKNLKDDNSYNIHEEDSKNFNVTIIYEDVSNISTIVLRIWYNATDNKEHNIHIGLWDWVNTEWDEEYGTISYSKNWVVLNPSVIDPKDHIGTGGNLGQVILRLLHDDEGDKGRSTHYFYIDYIVLVEGYNTLTTTIHDAQTGRDNFQTNHPPYATNLTNHDTRLTIAETNASNQDGRIITLESQTTTPQDNNITILYENASDQDGRIITLEEAGAIGTAPQDNNITILYLNASDQDARIIEEELSTSTMSGNITLLWANATEQYEYGLYVNGRAGDNAQAIVFIDQFINVLFENASDQYERILAEELSTSRMSGNITVLYENASDQDGRIITLESAGVGLDADIQAGLSYWDLNTSKGGLNISDADMLRVGSAGDDKEIKIRHDDTDGVINCSSGILNSFASGFENYDQNRRGGANEYLYKIGVSASTGDTSFIFAPEARSNGIKANCLGDFRIFNETCNFRVRSQLGDIYFDPIVGAKGSLRPEDNKEDDLGEADISWDNCYCDDYVTTSRGFLSSSTSAIDTVKILRTNPDGEVNHDTVSKSLEGEAGHGTLSVGALGMANSQAIKELEEIILAQNDRIKLLEAEK